jgi:hypothetical protein
MRILLNSATTTCPVGVQPCARIEKSQWPTPRSVLHV